MDLNKFSISSTNTLHQINRFFLIELDQAQVLQGQSLKILMMRKITFPDAILLMSIL